MERGKNILLRSLRRSCRGSSDDRPETLGHPGGFLVKSCTVEFLGRDRLRELGHPLDQIWPHRPLWIAPTAGTDGDTVINLCQFQSDLTPVWRCRCVHRGRDVQPAIPTAVTGWNDRCRTERLEWFKTYDSSLIRGESRSRHRM